MNLRQFEGKNVIVTTTDGTVYIGNVGDYIFPEDNEPEGIESIVLDIPKFPYPVEFTAGEIAKIELL